MRHSLRFAISRHARSGFLRARNMGRTEMRVKMRDEMPERSTSWSPETRRKAERARKRYRAGLSQEQVAAEEKISVARVCQYLAGLDEPARPRRGGSPPAGGIPV